ncbi:MAG: EAL domain-containing protein [Pseudomonadales bacterium]
MNIIVHSETAQSTANRPVSLALRQRRSDAPAPAAVNRKSNAEVIPFALAARKQQLASRRAASADLLRDNAELNQTLSQLAVSDTRSAETTDAYLLDCLLDAVKKDSFQVYYQTQHCLESSNVVGAEALLRLSDADGRLHNTQSLIDLAERYALVGLIGRQMMRKACNEFAELRRAGKVQGRLALNVSSLELRHAGYAEALMNAVQRAGLTPHDIELEITESQSLDLPGLKLQQLVELAEAGVDLAVDDFGTGYASWSSVARLPIRSVKLDRAMIAPLLQCERSQRLIANLVCCGIDMGFRVVAEGVQSPAQQQLLVELGCKTGQGFGLSLPKPLEAF